MSSTKSSSSPPPSPRPPSPPLPSDLRQRTAPFQLDIPPVRERFSEEGLDTPQQVQPQPVAFDIESQRPVPPPPAKMTWRQAYASCINHPAMRYIPIYAACVTTVGVYFGIRNYLFLDAAKTFSLVTRLQPVLVKAHEAIACSLRDIQIQINATDRVIKCPQDPLP